MSIYVVRINMLSNAKLVETVSGDEQGGLGIVNELWQDSPTS